MSSRLLSSLLFVALGACAAACAVDTAPDGSTEEPEQAEGAEAPVSAYSLSFVTIRRDARKCMAPMCGGFWVKDVNRFYAGEYYVSGLEFGPSGLDEELIAKVQEAPDSELVLRGRLGQKEAKYGTRPLLVYEAYRGMPGVQPIEGDIFYKAQDRDPNEVAQRLNSSAFYYFDSYSVDQAARPHVNKDWLIDRVNHHGAIAAASPLKKLPAGQKSVLDASQVYLNVADMVGPCPAFKLAACPEGQSWSYERSEDLCLHPVSCTEEGNCPSRVPPRCDEGYKVTAWRTGSPSCQKLVCDPAFVPTF